MGGGRQHYCVLDKIQRINFIFKVSLQFLIELNNIFQVKDLKIITFYVNLIDDGQKSNKKNIESFDLTQKKKYFKALTWKLFLLFNT